MKPLLELFEEYETELSASNGGCLARQDELRAEIVARIRHLEETVSAGMLMPPGHDVWVSSRGEWVPWEELTGAA